MKRELTMEQLEHIAYFAPAEAMAQGYDLTNEGERNSFLRHVEGSARQYFMKQNVWPFIQLHATLADGNILSVRAVAYWRDQTLEIKQWSIPLEGS
jgi:hypothetical protein